MADAKVDEKPLDAPQGAAEAEKKAPDGAYWESEAKKAFRERDEAKALARKFEEQQAEIQKKQLEETGKFKEAYERVAPEYESLKKFKGDYEAKQQAKLEQSETAIPAEFKDEYEKFIKKLDVESRIDWITSRLSVAPVATNSPANARPGTTGKVTGAVKEMSWEDRLKLVKEDPALFKKLV